MNRKNDIYLLYGTYGSPSENWILYLKEGLEQFRCDVIIPDLPTPENQNLESWTKSFSPYQKELNSDSILIGHSTGAAFILSILERLKEPIQAAFLISGFAHQLPDPAINIFVRSFVEKQFNWSKIRDSAKKFYIFHSENDDIVPFHEGQYLASKIGTPLTVVPHVSHFSDVTGDDQYKLILRNLEQELED